MRKWNDLVKDLSPESQKEIEVVRQKAAMVSQLIAIREAKGWTQEDLAERAGMKQSAIARFEGDSTASRIDTIIRIAIALGVKVTFAPENMGQSEAAAVSYI